MPMTAMPITVTPKSQPTTKSLLALRDIHFARHGKTILDAVDIDIRAGEIVTLIGPNGAGKTSLIKIALDLIRPNRGTVKRRRNMRIGYMPQRIEFDPTLPLTVQRFLELAPQKPSAQKIADVLIHAAAPSLSNAPVQTLSGGEMRRVLLARALLCDPDLLILDEPGAGMDINGQSDLYRLLREIRNRQRCGILLVSHDLLMVMAATDRVFCLNRHLCCSGKPAAVRRHPQFRALFGEQVASQLAVYQHRHDHAHDLHGDVRDNK